jgi:uncharacterized protein (TIGR01777 family)
MLGSALHRALVTRNFPVLQLVRSSHPSEPAQAVPVPANHEPSVPNRRTIVVALPGQFPWNPAADPPIAHPEVLNGFTAAIHLSGANVAAHRWTSAYKRELFASRVDSTRALAITLARLRHPPFAFIGASAVGIYGNRGDELLTETSASGSGFLADVCRQWEAAAQPAVQAGIRVVHLRFGVILGPGSGALAHIAPLFRLGLGGPLGSGQQWMSWISLADAIAAIVFALFTPALTGPVNLTAPNPVRNAEFTRALAHVLHRPAILPAPAFALRLALGPMADEALLASARVLPAKLQAAGFQFIHPSVDQALVAALAPKQKSPKQK